MKLICLIVCVLGIGSGAWAADEEAEIEDSVRVAVVGKLQTGIFAIGGETTGTTITANGITWELDLGRNAESRKIAEQLNGKKAFVQGRLERRGGVEIKERWIVTVTEIKPAKQAGSKTKEPTRNSAKAPMPFQVIEVQQSGGFAGVKIDYRITPDGKFTRKSRGETFRGELDAEDLKALQKAVANIDWDKLPKKLRNPNVADDFAYDIQFVIGKQTHHVNADGTPAGENSQLKPILLALNKMQAARNEK